MSAPVVSTRNLGKTLGSKAILRDISVEVETGSVVGIIGKNGAGKSTLMDVLLGFSPASAGSAQVFGHDSFTLPSVIKRRIGFVPQQDELVNELTGRQHLDLTAALLGRWNHALIGRLQSAWQVPLDQPAQQLSGGERQKLSTLLALGHEPDLLVLDEPVAALDPVSRRQFLQQLLEIADDSRRTVLFSTHIVSDLERVADRIWIVRDGTLAWAGTLDDLKESVVRLHISARRALSPNPPLPGVVSLRITGQRATAVVSQWNTDALPSLREALDADIDVEPMGLEDLFVELHS